METEPETFPLWLWEAPEGPGFCLGGKDFSGPGLWARPGHGVGEGKAEGSLPGPQPAPLPKDSERERL